MSHPIFTFIGPDGVTPVPEPQLSQLKAAVDAVNFPWDQLLEKMQLSLGSNYYVDPVTGLLGVPNPNDAPWGPRAHININYDTIPSGALSISNPMAGQISISGSSGIASTNFLVAYELGHVVDANWFRYDNAKRMQLRAIMQNPSLGWIGYRWGVGYADNNGEAWCSGFGMAFAAGFPIQADPSHHYPYPPSEVWQIPIIMGLGGEVPAIDVTATIPAGPLPAALLLHLHS